MLDAMVHQKVFIIISSQDRPSVPHICSSAKRLPLITKDASGFGEAEQRLMVGGLSRPDPPKGVQPDKADDAASLEASSATFAA